MEYYFYHIGFFLSDNNAPNQAMMFSSAVMEGKRKLLKCSGHESLIDSITLDSPVPYNLDNLLADLTQKDTEMVPGAKSEKQGPYYGKLTRFIQRLQSKQSDKRLNFLFCSD